MQNSFFSLYICTTIREILIAFCVFETKLTNNTQTRCIFIFFFVVVTDIYIVYRSTIYQCNMILLGINNNFICCSCSYSSSSSQMCSCSSLSCFAHKNNMWIYCIKLQKYLRYNCLIVDSWLIFIGFICRLCKKER